MGCKGYQKRLAQRQAREEVQFREHEEDKHAERATQVRGQKKQEQRRPTEQNNEKVAERQMQLLERWYAPQECKSSYAAIVAKATPEQIPAQVQMQIARLPLEILEVIFEMRIYKDIEQGTWSLGEQRNSLRSNHKLHKACMCTSSLASLLQVNRATHEFVRNRILRSGQDFTYALGSKWGWSLPAQSRPTRIVVEALSETLRGEQSERLFAQFQQALLRWWPCNSNVKFEIDLFLLMEWEQYQKRNIGRALRHADLRKLVIPPFQHIFHQIDSQVDWLMAIKPRNQYAKRDRSRALFLVLVCRIFMSCVQTGDVMRVRIPNDFRSFCPSRRKEYEAQERDANLPSYVPSLEEYRRPIEYTAFVSEAHVCRRAGVRFTYTERWEEWDEYDGCTHHEEDIFDE